MDENTLSKLIIGAALNVHTNLGPGLLESSYKAALAYELQIEGLKTRVHVNQPLIYKGVNLHVGYQLDLLIEEKVIVEVKSIEKLAPVHFAQTLTYLKLSNKKLALLINFNVKLLKDGVHRIVNGL
jgi:GxxExxY protein